MTLKPLRDRILKDGRCFEGGILKVDRFINHQMDPYLMKQVAIELIRRLTPITMVAETPEVQELAKLIKVKPLDVVEVLDTFQHCDPYLNRKDVIMGDLVLACQQVWRRFGNANPEELASYADQLKEYFK